MSFGSFSLCEPTCVKCQGLLLLTQNGSNHADKHAAAIYCSNSVPPPSPLCNSGLNINKRVVVISLGFRLLAKGSIVNNRTCNDVCTVCLSGTVNTQGRIMWKFSCARHICIGPILTALPIQSLGYPPSAILWNHSPSKKL